MVQRLLTIYCQSLKIHSDRAFLSESVLFNFLSDMVLRRVVSERAFFKGLSDEILIRFLNGRNPFFGFSLIQSFLGSQWEIFFRFLSYRFLFLGLHSSFPDMLLFFLSKTRAVTFHKLNKTISEKHEEILV